MEEYVIGAGALLTAEPNASVAGATLHAQTDPAVASKAKAILVDFESPRVEDLSKIVIVVSGWNRQRFELAVIAPLRTRFQVTLAEILTAAATAAHAEELHLFTRWLPDEPLAAAVESAGITLVSHPLEAIRQAALISGQTYQYWKAPLRAA
jgi:hypothetical protein